MKTLLVIIYVLSMAVGAKAQYCNFFAMTKDMVLSYQNFDSQGKETIKSQTTCLDVNTDNSGATIYKVKTEITDTTDVNLSFWEYELKCKDGRFFVNLGSFTDPELMKEYDDYDISIDTTGMEYPASFSAGQTLPDAKIAISRGGIGVTMKTFDVNVTNRKVVGVESVTVPSGTYDCFKITYDMKVKGLIKKRYNVAEYISEGVGRIKTETYNKKGKLMSSSLLVELKK